MKNENKTIIYLDMDGVIIDWLNGMLRHYKLPESFYSAFEADPSLVCEEAVSALYGGEAKLRKMIFDTPAEFWLNLEKLPWADELINALVSRYETAFFTSPGDNPESAKGKVMWQLKYHPKIPLIMGKHKHLAASENKILIDDTSKKIASFNEFGGLGIKWPNQFLMRQKSPAERTDIINQIIAVIESYRTVCNLLH